MATRTKPRTKAQELLHFARQMAAKSKSWVEYHNAIFGIGGKLGELFPTQAERVAFGKTPESKEIERLLEEQQGTDDALPVAGGKLLLRLPKSMHAALLKEAEAEGVSLNQLCVAKLATQLRAEVCVR
jgi:hypothetical protein